MEDSSVIQVAVGSRTYDDVRMNSTGDIVNQIKRIDDGCREAPALRLGSRYTRFASLILGNVD